MSETPAPPPSASDASPVTAPTPAVPATTRRPPRPGELTLGWRFVTVAVWIGVAAAFAAIWSASVQLGLSTWWLGPRADPRPALVRVGPFVPAVAMIVAAFNNVRWLCWWGLGAAALLVGVAVGDLDRVARLAGVEIAVALAAGAASVASLAGTYRRIDDTGRAASAASTATSTPQR